MNAVTVNRKAAARWASGHPWIYSSDVTDRGNAQPGETVRVADPKGRPLGTAHYSSTSQITLRQLSTRVEEIDRSFLAARLEEASAYRRRVVRETTAWRMVHAEADRLPALIVDRYGEYLVVQALDQGMDRMLPVILDLLESSAEGIVLRNDSLVRARESLPLDKSIVRGQVPPTVSVEMNGFRLEADLLEGQKTGIYLDQRENYAAAARYAKGSALDCFASTGGFALHMAGQVEHVEAVDSSATALEMARRNAAANRLENISFREADVFDLLSGYASARRHFGTIVLDPPAFAKSRSNLEGAARGYKEINRRALQLLDSGGILVTCSCSHHMSEAALLELIAEASLDTGRPLRVLERRTQSQDHPILLTVPETHYLKCLILEVI